MFGRSRVRPNKKNIATWIRALRSGRYIQGRGEMIGYRGYQTAQQKVVHCCLGVAAEEAIADGVAMKRIGLSYSWDDGTPNGATQGGLLPVPVRDWLGIDEANPLIGGHAATALNDVRMMSFDEIADMLSEQYEIEEDVHELPA